MSETGSIYGEIYGCSETRCVYLRHGDTTEHGGGTGPRAICDCDKVTCRLDCLGSDQEPSPPICGFSVAKGLSSL